MPGAWFQWVNYAPPPPGPNSIELALGFFELALGFFELALGFLCCEGIVCCIWSFLACHRGGVGVHLTGCSFFCFKCVVGAGGVILFARNVEDPEQVDFYFFFLISFRVNPNPNRGRDWCNNRHVQNGLFVAACLSGFLDFVAQVGTLGMKAWEEGSHMQLLWVLGGQIKCRPEKKSRKQVFDDHGGPRRRICTKTWPSLHSHTPCKDSGWNWWCACSCCSSKCNRERASSSEYWHELGTCLGCGYESRQHCGRETVIWGEFLTCIWIWVGSNSSSCSVSGSPMLSKVPTASSFCQTL